MAETSDDNSKPHLIFCYGTLKRGFNGTSPVRDFGSSDQGRALRTFDQGARPARFDELEGTSIGHYERLPVQLAVNADKDGVVPVEAEAYFAHRSFGEAMWERMGKEGLSEFTENEGKRYVKIQDRPHPRRSILEDVRHFVNLK